MQHPIQHKNLQLLLKLKEAPVYSQLSRLLLSPCQLLALLCSLHHLIVKLTHCHLNLIYILRLLHQLPERHQYCFHCLRFKAEFQEKYKKYNKKNAVARLILVVELILTLLKKKNSPSIFILSEMIYCGRRLYLVTGR